MCQNQLPPTVEVDYREELLSTTPKGRHFDEFPSMHHKAGGGPRRGMENAMEAVALPEQQVPESKSDNLLELVGEKVTHWSFLYTFN